MLCAAYVLIPSIRSRRLFDSWGGPKRWVDVPDADHDDISAFAPFWEAVSGFLADVRKD